jgi:glycosyltransferase involved in cell wall biosynthesis
MPNVSVVIPSYGDDRVLPSCLASVTKQLTAESEVIVVHSGASLSSEIKKNFSTVRFIESESRLYAGAARNRGAAIAKNEVLCFLDADCTWNELWFANLQEAFITYPQAKAFNGPVTLEESATPQMAALHFIEFHEFFSDRPRRLRFLHSGNLCILKSEFDNVGGFRENIPMCTDFTFVPPGKESILENSFYIPDLAICHQAHLTDPKALEVKMQTMGYWRGRIDETLPAHLRLRSHPVGRYLPIKILGFIFFINIFCRVLRRGVAFAPRTVLSFPYILKYCLLWGGGLAVGLKSNTN